MKITSVAECLKSLATVRRLFDIRDFLFFGGLAMLGYGLYLYAPWVSFSACGLILMLLGFFMRGAE